MATILIGTSGYSYTEWVGPVYPPGTSQGEYLNLYAQMFSTVELNFSYYRMPTADQMTRLLDQSGTQVMFSIKANESLTHTIDPDTWKQQANAFMSAVEVLAGHDKLGAVLLQFPYSFHYDPDRRRYLDAVLRHMGSLPLAIEFRNAQWYNNRTFQALRERNVALASIDLPALKGLPPVVDAKTADIAYIRLHGRNEETWWGSAAAARYDYLYSKHELETWVERIRAIAQQVTMIFIYFNNHRRGQAVANAKTLLQLLGKDRDS